MTRINMYTSNIGAAVSGRADVRKMLNDYEISQSIKFRDLIPS